MSNPYQEPETNPASVVRRGFTWAEWSIIVALCCILAAFFYGWHVEQSAAAARAELAIAQNDLTIAQTELNAAQAILGAAQAELEATQAALEAVRNTISEETEDLEPQVRELGRQIASLTVERNVAIERANNAELEANNRWQSFADALDSYIDAEVGEYWWRVRHVRPERATYNLPQARPATVQRRR